MKDEELKEIRDKIKEVEERIEAQIEEIEAQHRQIEAQHIMLRQIIKIMQSTNYFLQISICLKLIVIIEKQRKGGKIDHHTAVKSQCYFFIAVVFLRKQLIQLNKSTNQKGVTKC